MERALTIGSCIALTAVGLVVGAIFVNYSPWPIYGNSLSALVSGMAFGIPEVFLVRRYAPRAASFSRLDGAPFPFASLGLAAGVLIFGIR